MREANALAEEGVAPARIDAVMKRFGFPMGPFAMSDLSGLDIGLAGQKARGGDALAPNVWSDWSREAARAENDDGLFPIRQVGRKGREPIPDPVVEQLFAEEARTAGIAPREVSDEEIRERLLYALVNRGAYLLEEGIALRPSDIDIV